MKEQEKYKVIVTLVAGLLVISYVMKVEALVPVSLVILPKPRLTCHRL